MGPRRRNCGQDSVACQTFGLRCFGAFGHVFVKRTWPGAMLRRMVRRSGFGRVWSLEWQVIEVGEVASSVMLWILDKTHRVTRRLAMPTSMTIRCKWTSADFCQAAFFPVRRLGRSSNEPSIVWNPRIFSSRKCPHSSFGMASTIGDETNPRCEA